ncbi:hypothetical protein B296_00032231 [Ensete ventricosum]|uniref:glutathione transferase n=1 Tax=Ensete ventricosum TaxID=4639 RepID=A0A426YRH7_ENSVE|nr:hypothetical protein B296_00032231 [Ensete ventricosum]
MAALPGASMLKLYYGKPMLPDVSRVLACLYEKNVKFELIDMYEGQHMPYEFLSLQAFARAPVTVVEDGSTFTLGNALFHETHSSLALCRYISEKYADRGNTYLLGRDILERASIEQWLKLEEHNFHPPSWELVFHLAFATPMVDPDPDLITRSERRLASVLDVYDQCLSESEFLAGDEFTLADLSHLPNSHYLAASQQWCHLFDVRKNVRRWWESISKRPSWTNVVEMLTEVEVLKEQITSGEENTTTLHLLPCMFHQMPPPTTGYVLPAQVTQSIEVVPYSPPQSQPESIPSPPQTSPPQASVGELLHCRPPSVRVAQTTADVKFTSVSGGTSPTPADASQSSQQTSKTYKEDVSSSSYIVSLC